jgi:cytochrome c-type biogenesis protein CcmH/NrfG
MNPFSMTVLIVLIIAVAKVMSRRYQALGQQQQVVPGADAMRAQDEIRQLKERVAVLERVVTDSHGSIGLDREIERLRDR